MTKASVQKNILIKFIIFQDFTEEILNRIREYTLCKTTISEEKDKIMNISLENERNNIQIRIFIGEIDEISRILNSEIKDSNSYLSQYELEKRRLLSSLQDKNKELEKLLKKKKDILSEIEGYRKSLGGENSKNIQTLINEKNDDLEEIRRRMRIILIEKDDRISSIDFLNKRLKSYDNMAKVSENFKKIGSGDAPKILLEKLKKLQREYQNKGNNKMLESNWKAAKAELIDQMGSFINDKKKLMAFDNPSLISTNIEKREKYMGFNLEL